MNARTRALGIAALVASTALAPSAGAVGRTLEVGPGFAHATIGAALAEAQPGDTIRVAAGTYVERIRILRRVTLIGEGWPVVDGGGAGHVVEALAPFEMRGFVLRGSGSDLEAEHAGVMVRGAPARVIGNRMEDVLYGVYLKQSPGSLVAGNRIRGKPFNLARRGDGIRLWYSPDTHVTGNEVRGVRDVVAYFSDRIALDDNVVRESRYGFHLMYCSHSRLTGNRLSGNQVGAYLMYSSRFTLIGNVFADAAGSSGMGLGLKDGDEIVVEENLFLENSVGVHLDNSPSGPARPNRFEGNTFALNGVAVRMLPSVTGNRFHHNDFLANGAPARVAGGARAGQVAQNDWTGNHWSEHAGFDRDGDGKGDAPYVHAHLADDLLERRPELRIFAFAPALEALDGLVRFFPLLRPEPVVVDPEPRLAIAAARRWREEWRGARTADARAPLGWGLGAAASLVALAAGARRRERGP
ncbi:MAG TPA: nitrous oxide reductase family maturation protein NosD [Gemmatimonadota bacterium]